MPMSPSTLKHHRGNHVGQTWPELIRYRHAFRRLRFLAPTLRLDRTHADRLCRANRPVERRSVFLRVPKSSVAHPSTSEMRCFPCLDRTARLVPPLSLLI